MVSAWVTLQAELDAWAEAGRIATLWWRDDDATTVTPALEQLLDQARAAAVPVTLAVIPAAADPALPARLANEPLVTVAQHGFAHANHAAPSAKKAELGGDRSVPEMARELAHGFAHLAADFAPRWQPILVPPWNRIAADLLPGLASLGFRGVSTYAARAGRFAAPGLVQVNAHVDPIDWHGTRKFLGETATLALLIGHLRARRLGQADAGEPSGLLTHHAQADAGCDAFVERLLAETAAHPAARWIAAETAFAAEAA
jgi:hypothetical protein